MHRKDFLNGKIYQDLIINNFHHNTKMESHKPEVKANFRKPLRNENALKDKTVC